MARMSIDDMVVRDPRVTKLAALVGWSRREVVGCLVMDVWPICYDQRESVIASDLVDIASGHDGFAAAMVECGLAEWARGNRKVRIKGARERIEYLDHKRKSGSVGGLRSAESRRKNSSTAASSAQARGNPPVPDPSPSPVPDPVPVPEEREAATAPRSPALLELTAKVDAATGQPAEGHRQAVADFDARYRAAYGTKPSWGKKQGAQMGTLLRAHGLAEVQRRIAILFDTPPPWLRGPYDLGTLVQHFDKLVVAAVPATRTVGRAEPQEAQVYAADEGRTF